MDVHEYFNTLNRGDNYYVQIPSNEPSVTKKDTVEANNTLDLVVIGTIAFASVVTVLWQLFSPKNPGSLPKIRKASTQTNCTKCRFFDDNFYLKCAVQPSKVLKKEARECMDYESTSSTKEENT